MNNLWFDLRYALRQLRQAPGFAFTAILTLAFGIGATTAIFSIVEGVLLRPLPFPQQNQLLLLGNVPEGVDLQGNAANITAPGALIYMRDTRAFQALGAYQQAGFEFSGSGEPAQINAARLSASVFPVLSVSPLMGRTFTQQEDQ